MTHLAVALYGPVLIGDQQVHRRRVIETAYHNYASARALVSRGSRKHYHPFFERY